MDTTTAQGCVHNYIPIETHIDCELGEPMMVAPRTRRCCSCDGVLGFDCRLCVRCGTVQSTGRRLRTRRLDVHSAMSPESVGALALIFGAAALGFVIARISADVLDRDLRLLSSLLSVLTALPFSVHQFCSAVDLLQRRGDMSASLRLSSCAFGAHACAARVGLGILAMFGMGLAAGVPSPEAVALGVIVAFAWPLFLQWWLEGLHERTARTVAA